MRSLSFSAALLRGVCGFGGLRIMRESAATAAELEADPASPWYALARAGLGFSLYLSGEPEAAAASLAEAAQSQASYPLTRMFSLSVLSLVAVELGRLPQAQEAADAARILAGRDDLDEAPQSSLAYTATGAVHAAHGQLDEARLDLEHALAFRRNLSAITPWHTFEPTLLLARVLLELGDRAGAAELAANARDVLTALPDGAEAQLARLAELDQRIAARPGACGHSPCRSPSVRWLCCVCSGARSRYARSGRSCTYPRTRSRPIRRRFTASSACPPGTMR